MNELLTTLVIGGGIGALLGFLQFLIKFIADKKKNKSVSKSECNAIGKKYEEFFKHDKEKLDELSVVAKANTDALQVIIKSVDVMLEHMATNNATGRIAESQEEIHNFLYGQIDKIKK